MRAIGDDRCLDAARAIAWIDRRVWPNPRCLIAGVRALLTVGSDTT